MGHYFRKFLYFSWNLFAQKFGSPFLQSKWEEIIIITPLNYPGDHAIVLKDQWRLFLPNDAVDDQYDSYSVHGCFPKLKALNVSEV